MTEEIQERIDLEQEPEKSPPKWFWPVLGTIFIVFILTMTVLMIRLLRINIQKATVPQVMPTPTAGARPVTETDFPTAKLEQQGTSDEIDDIEADLEATDLAGIDQELEDIEAELDERN